MMKMTTMHLRWAAPFLLSLFIVACSSDDGAPVSRPRVVRQAIVNGTASTAAQSSVVQIGIIGSKGKMIPHCTGTLIAKNLVITARHCVGDVEESDASVTDFASSKLAFYTGLEAGAKTVSTPPEANGKKTFDNGTKDLAPDIAVVLLDKDLVTASIAPIRLDSGAKKGETIDIVGFGVDATGNYPKQRQQRAGLKIAAVYPASTAFFELFKGEFQIGEAACSGDSGGPAFDSSTKALIGIASRVSNGKFDGAPQESCIGAATEDVFTDLTPAASYIRAAFEAASAEPWIEGEPSPDEKAAAAAAAEEEEKKKQQAAVAPSAEGDDGCSISSPSSSSSSSSAWCAGVSLALLLTAARRRHARVDRHPIKIRL